MPPIPNLRTRNGAVSTMAFGPMFQWQALSLDPVTPVCPQGYLDTPQIIYSEWNRFAGGINKELGTLPPDFKVCLIGAGISNVTAALELRKAGATVTLIEARGEVGGRTRSIPMPDRVNIAELGAMRFPPSEDLLYYYAENFGFTFLPNYPNPGEFPTIVSYKGSAYYWDDRTQIPPAFETVYNGWDALIKHGIQKDGNTVLESSDQLSKWLEEPEPSMREKVIPAWQAYLNTFGSDSFRSGLIRIFGKSHEWDIPGGRVWTDDDFAKFGALGIGSGGFGAFYTSAFNTVFRCVPNRLETNQATFAKQVGEKVEPMAIQDLTRAIWEKASAMGVTTKLNTTAEVVCSQRDPKGWPKVTVIETQANGTSISTDYNLVIVGTTTRAMNVGMHLTSYQPGTTQFLLPNTCAAIDAVHMASSTKLFIRTSKFWESNGSDFPRNILSDTKAPQLYTLDYGHQKYGMVLITYSWEDLSNQLTSVSDPNVLLNLLKRQIADIMKDTSYPDYDKHLVPLTPDDIYMIHWQLDKNSFGAFAHAQPGQDKDCSAMFYDFAKLHSEKDNTGVLINGDCTSFFSGWIDGGLQPAMNIVSGVLKKYGTLAEKAAKYAPVNVIKSDTYQY